MESTGASFLFKDDGTGGTVPLACPTLYAEFRIDLAAGLAFFDSADRTAHNACPAQNAFIGDYIGHCSILGGVLAKYGRFGNLPESF
jgi:hypothetical protein